MKKLFFVVSIIALGACSKPSVEIITYFPDTIHKLAIDSINSGILLNGTDIVATTDYLVIANSQKDTIFDVFDINNLKHLYSGITLGHGPNEILNFRSLRHIDGNNLYTIGVGVPLITPISITSQLNIGKKKMVDYGNDICQNLYLLSSDSILIQSDKNGGEWSIYYNNSKNLVDLPKSIFNGYEPSRNNIKIFQYRSVNVAIKKDKSRFAFFNCQLPYVRIFNSDGTLIHHSFVEEEPNNYYSLLLENKTYYSRCCATNDYIFIKYYSDNKQKEKTNIQVWDWGGNLKYLIELDKELILFTVNSDGNRLYGLKLDSDYIYYCDLTQIFD